MIETENYDNHKIKSLVVKLIEEKKPETIKQLINLIKKETKIPEEQIFSIIQELEEEKTLRFNELVFPESVTDYLLSFKATWYWTILFLSMLTVIFAFTIPENLVPQIYARNILGLIFILYFPGFTVIKAVYPIRLPLQTHSIMLDNIERVTLSMGLSLAVTPMVGLILYYTPLGLNLVTIVFSLFAVTVILSTTAILREYHARRAIFLRRLAIVTQYELSNNALKFFDVGGLLIKQLILIKEIPLEKITNIESLGNELSVTWEGSTDLFFMKYDSKSVTELREKILGMLQSSK